MTWATRTTSTTLLTGVLCIGQLFTCHLSFASDISREVSGDDGNNFFEISAGLGCGQSDRILPAEDEEGDCSWGWGFGGEYHWKGLFVEAIQNSYSGLNLGYNIYQSDNWSVDFIGLNITGRASTENIDDTTPSMTEEERNTYLLKRDTFAVNAGLRATHYWQDNIIQFRIDTDYSDQEAGASGSVLFGRAWQLRNWNIHGLVGLHWHSRQNTQYLWNVSPEEATTRFPEYNASSALNYSFELGATYPISENWISRTRVVLFTLDEPVSDSPLSNEDWFGGFSTSISYVF